jgi:hypothetical protein
LCELLHIISLALEEDLFMIVNMLTMSIKTAMTKGKEKIIGRSRILSLFGQKWLKHRGKPPESSKRFSENS